MGDILLLTLSIPRQPGEVDADPDDVADALVEMVNDQRRRDCEEAGRPEDYSPVMVNLLPVCPQWLDTTAQQMLIKAIQIVNYGYARVDAGTPIAERSSLDAAREMALSPRDTPFADGLGGGL